MLKVGVCLCVCARHQDMRTRARQTRSRLVPEKIRGCAWVRVKQQRMRPAEESRLVEVHTAATADLHVRSGKGCETRGDDAHAAR